MSKGLRITSMIGIATLLPLLMTPFASAQQAVIASDNFNRANESPLAVGGNWQRFAGPGFVDLTGNQIAGVSEDALYYWQGAGTFSNTEQFSRAKVTNAGGQVGVTLLATSDQAVVAAWKAGTLFVYWYAAGSYKGNLTTAASTLQNGDVIEARLEAGTISAKVNGNVIASAANTTTLSSGRPGFETYQSGATLDDWEGGGPVTGKCAGASDGTPCDDGDLCTQTDTCKSGVCVGDNPVVCIPSDLCHAVGVCDPASGTCFNPPISCNDNNDCTADSCDPATGCVHKNVGDNCDDGNPCTVDTCNPAGGCLHTGSDGSDNSCGKVTDSSLCSLPVGLCGSSQTVPEFKLVDLQDPTFSAIQGTTVLNDYIINASNPGQFYYNVFQAGTPGAAVDLTIEVPFPFVTQGAHPIQLYSSAGSRGSCYVPGPSLDGFTITTDGGNLSPAGYAVILRSDYGVQNLGNTTSVHVTGTVPASGLVYVTIHLDYGLKKVTGWQQASNFTTLQGPDTNLDGTLDGLGGGPITIASPQPYEFSFDGGGSTHAFAPSSCNKFRKNRGVNGNTIAGATSNPVASVRVQFFGPTGTLIATTTTDRDGFYTITYKHTGKAANFTVKLPDYGTQKTVTLKANGFARVNFEDLLQRSTNTSIGE